MKSWVRLFLLAASLVAVGSAQAGTVSSSLRGAANAVMVPVPPEWDGVWDVEDSTFDCTAGFTGVSTYKDTICGGKDIYAVPPGGFTYDCTGTVNATTIHMTCTGTFDPVADCTITTTNQVDGTITATTFDLVIVTNTTHSGTNPLCDFFPDSCKRHKTTGTRTGPAPLEYCATPTRAGTWGEVKARYR